MPESARENVAAALAAIERHDEAINAFVTVTADQAREAADAADHAAGEGRWLGLLHGMTMAIKDNIQTAGVRTTSGSLHFKDVVPNQDAFVVQRLRAAGAVIVGKATMHELAFGIRSDNPVSGQCRNPWDQSRIPGGSSGGSGAAVAAGMAQAALGSDTGGSIRLPAAMNGIAGLRPTHGRVPNHGSTPVSASYDTIGPMARRVGDLARILAVTAHGEPGAPGAAPTAAPDLGNFLPTLNDGVAGLRIGVPRNHYFLACGDGIAEAAMAAVRALEAEGARIVEVDVEGAEAAHQWATIQIYADACAFHAERLDRNPELFSTPVLERMLVGRSFTAVDYANACRAREAWQRSLASLYQDIDILVSPTTPAPPAPIEEDKSLLEATKDASRNTYAGGFGANPGLSLPCGFGGDGLPIGLQLEAAWWQEPMLLRAGMSYQAVTDWHLAEPPLP
ncbi:MAG: amidase [Alphaproteobacteria bacterium]|nr:amidase [Alphaproteobacteria bacterium]